MINSEPSYIMAYSTHAAALIGMWRGGATYKQIAAATGFDEMAVTYLLTKYEQEHPWPKLKKYIPSSLQEVKAAVQHKEIVHSSVHHQPLQ